MNTIQRRTVVLGCALLAALLTGCSAVTGKKDRDLSDAILTSPLKVDIPAVGKSGVARTSGASDCGNEPNYTLNGRSYQVLPSATGYREDGMASWYGAEFQGSPTAGCEVFDMHAFTAAHRTLPLPSYVRVTNLQNKRTVIVKVNDRGPFDGSGLIQLSFAAASTLGMTSGSRSVKVRLEGLKAGAGSGVRMPSVSTGRVASAGAGRVKRPTPAQVAAIQKAKKRGKSFYVVVKNYQSQGDALDMFVRLTSVGLNKTEMASAVSKGRKVHQVRVGPLYTQDQIDNVKDTLEGNGLATFKVVEVDQ